jgi:hypothetical protein
VIRQIRERAAGGKSLLASVVHSHAPALRDAAERLFKKEWPDIIRGLGFPYEGRKRWSKEKVVRALHRLHRARPKMNCESVRRHDLALAQAAARYFKTWPRALRAAGIDPDTIRLKH